MTELSLDKLCQHNFENNRYSQEYENNAGIIGKAWAKACKLILLIQPSSAAVEHAFSLLENSFSKRQEHSLEDYVSLSIMLQYNRKH